MPRFLRLLNSALIMTAAVGLISCGSEGAANQPERHSQADEPSPSQLTDEPTHETHSTTLSAENADKLEAIEALGVGGSTRRLVEESAERNQQLEAVLEDSP